MLHGTKEGLQPGTLAGQLMRFNLSHLVKRLFQAASIHQPPPTTSHAYQLPLAAFLHGRNLLSLGANDAQIPPVTQARTRRA
eukprot:1159354-Pelagomonas_calceolata.AAC.3